MSKSVGEIRLDYNKAIQQADTLSGIAQKLRNMANKDFQECISEISHNWTGENSTAYIRKCEILKSNMIRTAEKLEKASSTIRQIAKNTYNAEMSAFRIAFARKY